MSWGVGVVGKQRSVGEGVYLEEHFGSLCESLCKHPALAPVVGWTLTLLNQL